jgi:WhiB family redox-sensing transcriptional regulator
MHTTTDIDETVRQVQIPVIEPVDLLPTRKARCADGDGGLTHLFFSDDAVDLARAKAICARCTLAEACLTGALDRAEHYGVWGGHLLMDGVIVEDRPRRGRPPRTPRPVLIMDEVPVPPHLIAS